jgi:hypothetical protein
MSEYASGGVRIIQDLSPWTKYYNKPRFTLKDAARALETIPQGSYLVKIDLRDAFWQIPINEQSQRFYGVYLEGEYYTWTRLPMGHALAPAILQRWARAVIQEVFDRFQTLMICYLDDWLLVRPESDNEVFRNIIQFLSGDLGITINR